jgi:hypothetical protein
MPTYVYACPKCKVEVEVIKPMAEVFQPYLCRGIGRRHAAVECCRVLQPFAARVRNPAVPRRTR